MKKHYLYNAKRKQQNEKGNKNNFINITWNCTKTIPIPDIFIM